MDLQAIIDTGRGGVPLIAVRFRCASGACITDSVVMAKVAGVRAEIRQ